MQKLKKAMLDLGALAGVMAFIFGLYQVWCPLAWMVGGVLLAGGCFFSGYDQHRRSAIDSLRRGGR